jgi:hypothetical protein
MHPLRHRLGNNHQVRRAEHIRAQVLHMQPAQHRRAPPPLRFGHDLQHAGRSEHENGHHRVRGHVVHEVEGDVRRVPHYDKLVH